MAPQSASVKTPPRPRFGDQERVAVLPAPAKVDPRHTVLNLKSRSAVTPAGFDIVRVAAGSMGRPIREAPIEIGRFVRMAIGRFSTLVRNWLERDVEGRRIQRLSDHMLKDIGAFHQDVDYRVK